MKKYNFIAFLKTSILAIAIIVIGYNLLSLIVSEIIVKDSKISTLSPLKNESYVFYSSGEEDIVLFPWNYYEQSVPAVKGFNTYFDDSINDFSDILDSDYLYNTIRYFFYKSISPEKKEYIFNSDTSLSEIMNYGDLINNTTYYNDIGIFFYKSIITIDNTDYNLEFSFSDSGYLYSFLCNEICDDSLYTDDIMDSAFDNLSALLQNQKGVLDLFLNDFFAEDDSIKNYNINTIINSIDSSSNDTSYDEEKNNDNYDNYSNEEYFKESIAADTFENTNNIDFAIENNNTLNGSGVTENENWTYQLIQSDNEYLLLLSDYELVFHYNPVTHTFAGFNFLYNY